jgi:hypothetical protein
MLGFDRAVMSAVSIVKIVDDNRVVLLVLFRYGHWRF